MGMRLNLKIINYFSNFIFGGIFVISLLNPIALHSQAGELPEIEKASDLFNLGKKYLKTENFRDAGMTFEVALANPLNRVTTGCLFYAGLCWYKTGDFEEFIRFVIRRIFKQPVGNVHHGIKANHIIGAKRGGFWVTDNRACQLIHFLNS